MSRADLLLGADIGGSKMRFWLEDATTGSAIADRTFANPIWTKAADDERATLLVLAIRDVIGGKGQLRALVAGVHGNDSPEQQALYEAALAPLAERVEVLNDSSLLVLAAGLERGTGLIAGTGSSATATTDTGAVITVGGWGWLVGDEGGAVGIVREGVRQVLVDHDRLTPDGLTTALLEALGQSHAHALPLHLASTEPEQWAKAAAAVFAAAEAGSDSARTVIAINAGAMAGMIETLRARGGHIENIICAGGVITHQPALFQAFETAVGRRLGGAVAVSLLEDPPVKGAINRARRLFALQPARRAEPETVTSI